MTDAEHAALVARSHSDFLQEFPYFTTADIPAPPEDFADESWHNDTCPRFYSVARNLTLIVAHPVPSEREFPEGSRFILQMGDLNHDEGPILAATDDWSAILRALPPLPEPRLFRVYRGDVRYTEVAARFAHEAITLADDGLPFERWWQHGRLAVAIPVRDKADKYHVALSVTAGAAAEGHR